MNPAPNHPSESASDLSASGPSPAASGAPIYVTDAAADAAAGAAGTVKLRGSTKTIAIVLLVLGAAGILSTLFRVAVAAFLFWLTQGQTGDPALDRVAQTLNNELSVPSLSMHAIGLVLSILAIFGGIGTLRRNLGFAVLLRRTALAMAVFAVVRSGIGIDSQIRNKEAVVRDMQAQLAANPDPNLPDLGAFVNVLFYLVLGFGLLMPLAFTAFYLWSYFHLRKPEIVAQLK